MVAALFGPLARYLGPFSVFLSACVVMLVGLHLADYQVFGVDDPLIGSSSSAVEESSLERLATFLGFQLWVLALLVPLLAAQLWLLFRRASPAYRDHLAFSLSVHALIFLVVGVAYPLDRLFGLEQGAFEAPLALAGAAWCFVALRRAYGESWLRTAWKSLVLLVAHSVAVSLVLFGSMALGALVALGTL